MYQIFTIKIYYKKNSAKNDWKGKYLQWSYEQNLKYNSVKLACARLLKNLKMRELNRLKSSHFLTLSGTLLKGQP